MTILDALAVFESSRWWHISRGGCTLTIRDPEDRRHRVEARVVRRRKNGETLAGMIVRCAELACARLRSGWTPAIRPVSPQEPPADFGLLRAIGRARRGEGFRAWSRQSRLDFSAEIPKAPRAAELLHFHARAHVPVEEAIERDRKASGQEAAILSWWRLQDAAVPGVRFTPSQVHRALEALGPLTSIRRAMTDLSGGKPGYTNATSDEEPQVVPQLCHHEEDRRPGPYGERYPESTWCLRASCQTHGALSFSPKVGT